MTMKGATMFRSILLPTDGSPLSTRAAKYAIRLAASTGARITALHVIAYFEAPSYFEGTAVYAETFSPKEYKRVTEARARTMLAKVKKLADAASVRCEVMTVNARSPSEGIIKAAKAKRCDGIVMASHGRRGLQAVLLGSETSKVLAHSKMPVLVCR
jgi:nucleotide-binding universal stress UspA family protein